MKKWIQMILIGLLSIFSLQGQELEEYKWKNRILIIESPSISNTEYKDQLEALANSKQELEDRKLILIEIIENEFRTTHFPPDPNSETWKSIENRGDHSKSKGKEFKVILIGLDGGIKLEKKEILKKEELFGLIDGMPMRKSEIKNKAKRNDKGN